MMIMMMNDLIIEGEVKEMMMNIHHSEKEREREKERKREFKNSEKIRRRKR